MVDLTVAMRTISFFLLLILLLLIPQSVFAASTQPQISTPEPGAVLQGQVKVSGTAAGSEFSGYELSFAFANQSEILWFPIHQSKTPVEAGDLATWDTTTITDGNYNLRLVVTYSDGSTAETIVSDLRIRNYTPIETPTPEIQLNGSIPLQATVVMSSTPPSAKAPTATALPANPAAVTPASVRWVMIIGAALGGLSLLLLAIYQAARNMLLR